MGTCSSSIFNNEQIKKELSTRFYEIGTKNRNSRAQFLFYLFVVIYNILEGCYQMHVY